MSATSQPVRIITAAALFDGHDAAINLVRRLLVAQGAQVVHLGARPERGGDRQGGRGGGRRRRVRLLLPGRAHGVLHLPGGEPQGRGRRPHQGLRRRRRRDHARRGPAPGGRGRGEDLHPRRRHAPGRRGHDRGPPGPHGAEPRRAPGATPHLAGQPRPCPASSPPPWRARPRRAPAPRPPSWASPAPAAPARAPSRTSCCAGCSWTSRTSGSRSWPSTPPARLRAGPSWGTASAWAPAPTAGSSSAASRRPRAPPPPPWSAPGPRPSERCGAGLVLVETSGIGQGDTDILDMADAAVYVMTSEFGAGTQLEKINMLDYAQLVVINKYEDKRAEDALQAVRRQVRRTARSPPRSPTTSSPSTAPPRGTSTTPAWTGSTSTSWRSCGSPWPRSGPPPAGPRRPSPSPANAPRPSCPSSEAVLQEIVKAVRGYKHRTRELAASADRVQALEAVSADLGEVPEILKERLGPRGGTWRRARPSSGTGRP